MGEADDGLAAQRQRKSRLAVSLGRAFGIVHLEQRMLDSSADLRITRLSLVTAIPDARDHQHHPPDKMTKTPKTSSVSLARTISVRLACDYFTATRYSWLRDGSWLSGNSGVVKGDERQRGGNDMVLQHFSHTTSRTSGT